MSSDVRAFYVFVIAMTSTFELESMNIRSRPPNFLTILLPINHSSKCKLKVYIRTDSPKGNNLRQIDIFFKIGKAMEVKRVSKV